MCVIKSKSIKINLKIYLLMTGFVLKKFEDFIFTDMTAHHLNSDNKNNRCHKVFCKYFRSFKHSNQNMENKF